MMRTVMMLIMMVVVSGWQWAWYAEDKNNTDNNDACFRMSMGVVSRRRVGLLLLQLLVMDIATVKSSPPHKLSLRAVQRESHSPQGTHSSQQSPPSAQSANMQTGVTSNTDRQGIVPGRPQPSTVVADPGRQSSGEAPEINNCLLYTSPSPRDVPRSRMPSSA